MNEIMENMNELKDKLFAAIDTICKDYETKAPEFKVPGWVLFRGLNGIKIIYATTKSSDYFKDDSGYRYFIKDCRLTTPQEIESHLRKIAAEKGFKTGVKVKFKSCNEERILHGEMFYKSDWLVTEDALCFGMDVIWRPKSGWAEIIPDKKLPCTKDEATKLIQEYTNYYRKDSGCNVFEFLNDYTE